MKTSKTIIVMICFVLSLCSCGHASDSGNLFDIYEEEKSNIIETTQLNENVISVQNDNGTKSFTSDNYYQYGNMQTKDLPSGDFMLYEGNIVFEVERNGQIALYTINPDTLEVLPFSSDATQTDEDRQGAHFSGGNLEQYQGRLYGMVNLHGNVGVWENDHWEKLYDGAVNGFLHADGKLYVITEDQSLVKITDQGVQIIIDEYLAACNVIQDSILYGWDLGSFYGKLFTVDLTASYPEVKILLSGVKGGMTDVESGMIYYADEKTMQLYCCRLDGSEPEQLTDYGIFPYGMNFDEDYLYFRAFDPDLEQPYSMTASEGCARILRMNKKEPADVKVIADFQIGYVYHIYTVPGSDYIFAKYYEEYMGEIKTFAVAIDGSGYQEIVIPE